MSVQGFKVMMDPLHECDGFIRFTSGAIHVNCIVVSMAAEPFQPLSDISISIDGAQTHDQACHSTMLLTIWQLQLDCELKLI